MGMRNNDWVKIQVIGKILNVITKQINSLCTWGFNDRDN
ncbi:hypothetical protein J2799_000153 [Chryseobacterium vietnamense]|nr:hypothetical protein [Chryseobacterium vietnamense]